MYCTDKKYKYKVFYSAVITNRSHPLNTTTYKKTPQTTGIWVCHLKTTRQRKKNIIYNNTYKKSKGYTSTILESTHRSTL